MTTVPQDGTLEKSRSRADVSTAVGEFRITVRTGAWWWSDRLYRLHGFDPGEVVPTTELVLSHVHPDDRERIAAALEKAGCADEPFGLIYRVVDAQGTGHVVSTVGSARCDEAGRVVELDGYTLDLTASVRQMAAAEADVSIRAAALSRRDIEQAKGVLMMVLGVDDEKAFGIMRRLSNDSNTPLRELASDLMTTAREAEPPAREAVLEYLRTLRQDSGPAS
ncbi:PAS and ANTAR domain-containing protein [Isoptericola aurantiacus]|uniref:PAS and ANTAR domain-containing protein n=1 Tax=Isoptericola aurantiacus TaxID=3377839 RepID=UPI00383BAA25